MTYQQQQQQLDSKQLNNIGRTFSYYLRHQGRKAGLNINDEGFAYVDELLKLPKLRSFQRRLTIRNIEEIVQNDNKNRFTLRKDEKSGKYKIRANQGHSISVPNLELKQIVETCQCKTMIHGTYFKNWKSIEKQGLKCFSREYIHFARGLPGQNGVISGMRGSCDIIIFINVEKLLKDGILLYESTNKVLLTKGIENCLPLKYFEKVVERKTGKKIFTSERIRERSE